MEYFAECLDVLQVLLADLLSLGRVQIKFIIARVQKLIRADHCLLKLRKTFGKFELFDVGQWSRGSSRGPDVRRGFEEFHVCQF